MDDRIKEFFEQCQSLNGQVLKERPTWNEEASKQAIRHFSICVTDDNPLWIDKDYAEKSPNQGITAPPAFVTSVKYPILHGARMDIPMFNLANRLEMEWAQPIRVGDQLTGSLKQTGVTHGRDRRGRDIIYIETEGTYQNQKDELVCKSIGTLAWVARDEQEKKDRESWKIHTYTEEESQALEKAILARKRTGNQLWDLSELQPGTHIPDLVHPPLSTGDIACWEAANGPAYRAGNLGFQDAHAKPLSTVINPVTGWRVNRVQSHGDHLLAASRGMPGPFDSGVMRFAWVSVLVTDWMGDAASLKHLSVNVQAPLLYGDAMTTSGIIVKTTEGLEEIIVDLRLDAKNQRGETISTGEATVAIPHRALQSQKESPYKLLQSTPQSATTEKKTLTRISDLSERHTKNQPEAPAVRDNERILSNQALSIRSNQLAHRILELGARNNTAVAVMLPRSTDWITSILAISKAGAIYVPIDPGQPKSRRNFMIREADTRILITSSDLVPEQSFDDLKVIHLNPSEDSPGSQTTSLPDTSVEAQSIAYVMFTSGSTGKPKGVAISYGALDSYLKSLKSDLGLEDTDIYLNTATFSFSASIRQCFHPLATGILQVIASEAQQKDPLKLVDLIEASGATVWDTVPSAWDTCMTRILDAHQEQAGVERLASIRRILLTGEALTWRLPRKWWQHFNKETQVINLYSQTETTGTAAYFSILKDDPDCSESEMVAIGQAMPDVEIRLQQDERIHPIATGQEGEICVMGERLASGYLDPSHNNQAFDSFSENTKEVRLYRTGDLARVDDDQQLHFAGRADRRIKLRGFRVDLGEIESTLNQIPGVKESWVIPHFKNATDLPSGILAAYRIDTDFEGEPPQVKQQLKDQLPDYMVPKRMLIISEAPRTPSGKLDQKTLAAQILDSAQTGEDVILPRNETEEQLHGIWKQVLGQKSISVNQDFFDLGGDSLSALTLITEIEKRFERPLPLDAIFETTTIEGLAKSLLGSNDASETNSETSKTGASSQLMEQYPEQFRKLVSLVSGRKGNRLHPASLIVTITPDAGNGKPPLFFCANGQSEAEALAEILGPDHPLYFLESGFYAISRTNGVIRSLAKHHLPDILNLYPSGPYDILGYSFGCSTTLVLAELLKQQNRKISFIGLLDARIGPRSAYRWYFKHIDQSIAKHLETERKKFSEAWKKKGITGAMAQTGRSIGSALRINRKAKESSEERNARPYADIIPSNEPPFQSPPFNGTIHLLRASDHWFRNLLFPRAGFPKASYPDLRVTKIQGSHHTVMTEEAFRIKVCEVIQDALNQTSE